MATHHDTTQNKPSTMEHLKDKASNLVHKVAGKLQGHDDPAHETTLNSTADPLHHQNVADHRREKREEGPAGTYHQYQAPQPLPQQQQHQPIDKPTDKHSGPLHTGAALAGAAVPHGTTVDRTAYQKQQQQHHQQPAGIPPPVVPVTDTHAASGIHHPTPAGPTGTTNVPTYAHNVAPTASGAVPKSYMAGQDPGLTRDAALDQDHLQHQWYKGQGAASGLPVNTNNSADPTSGQSAPVHSINPATVSNPSGATAPTVPTNTVPAMGAPGTTTAAGTHIPGEFTSGSKANTASRPFDKPADNHTPFF